MSRFRGLGPFPVLALILAGAVLAVVQTDENSAPARVSLQHLLPSSAGDAVAHGASGTSIQSRQQLWQWSMVQLVCPQGLQPPQEWPMLQVISDERIPLERLGAARFRVAAGKHLLGATEPRWWIGDQPEAYQAGQEYRLSCQPLALAEIDVVYPDGTPASNATLSWAADSSTTPEWVQAWLAEQEGSPCSEEGHASLWIPYGSGTIHARTADGRMGEAHLPLGVVDHQRVLVVLPRADEASRVVHIASAEDGSPIAGANITLGSESRQSDAFGEVRIPERWAQSPGVVRIAAPQHLDAVLGLGGQIPDQILLDPSSELELTVVDALGVPVPAARLHLFQNLPFRFGPGPRSVLRIGLRTNADGQCRFPIAPDLDAQVLACDQEGRFGSLFFAGSSHDRDLQLVIQPVEDLRLSIHDAGGVQLDPKQAVIGVFDINGMPMNHQIDQQGRLVVATPAWVQRIHMKFVGALQVQLNRADLQQLRLPLPVDDLGGTLHLRLRRGHRFVGTVDDEWGRPVADAALRLVPQRLAALQADEGKEWVQLEPGPWTAAVSLAALETRSDAQGRFTFQGVPAGLWTLERQSVGARRSLGSGGNTDHPIAIPGAEDTVYTVSGEVGLNLTVIDALNGRPVPAFVLRQVHDPLTNSSVGAERGRNGFLQTRVRTTALAELELAASGYRVERLLLPIDPDTQRLDRVVRLQPTIAGRLHLEIDPGLELAGAMVRIVDVGARGISLPGRERWEYRMPLVDGETVQEFPAPGAEAHLRLHLEGAADGLRIEPADFEYRPGEVLQARLVARL